MGERLRRFFVREDSEYDTFVAKYQAKTVAGKLFYLFMHLLPGFLAYALINVPSAHAVALKITRLSDIMFQGTCLVGVVFVWHAVVPLQLSAGWTNSLLRSHSHF